MKGKIWAIVIFLVLVFLFFVQPQSLYKSGTNKNIIISGGLNRSYLLHVPLSYNNSKTALIFAFHGMGDTASNFEQHTQFSKLADKNNFFIVYPESYINSWADGRGVAIEDSKGVNDMQFVKDVLNDVKSKYIVDTSHIYVTGFSSGGYFTHKLACEDSDIFKAFAPVGAGFPDTLNESCHPTQPRSLLFIIGSEDQAYSGAQTESGIYIKSADDTLNKWAEINGCSGMALKKESTIITKEYSLCKNSTRIEEKVFSGIEHSWSMNLNNNTSEEIMNFFREEI